MATRKLQKKIIKSAKMRYVDCCKSTKKNKKCARKDGKHFSLQRRFSKKKCIKESIKGFTMKASCAPYKFCKKKSHSKKSRKKYKFRGYHYPHNITHRRRHISGGAPKADGWKRDRRMTLYLDEAAKVPHGLAVEVAAWAWKNKLKDIKDGDKVTAVGLAELLEQVEKDLKNKRTRLAEAQENVFLLVNAPTARRQHGLLSVKLADAREVVDKLTKEVKKVRVIRDILVNDENVKSIDKKDEPIWQEVSWFYNSLPPLPPLPSPDDTNLARAELLVKKTKSAPDSWMPKKVGKNARLQYYFVTHSDINGGTPPRQWDTVVLATPDNSQGVTFRTWSQTRKLSDCTNNNQEINRLGGIIDETIVMNPLTFSNFSELHREYKKPKGANKQSLAAVISVVYNWCVSPQAPPPPPPPPEVVEAAAQAQAEQMNVIMKEVDRLERDGNHAGAASLLEKKLVEIKKAYDEATGPAVGEQLTRQLAKLIAERDKLEAQVDLDRRMTFSTDGYNYEDKLNEKNDSISKLLMSQHSAKSLEDKWGLETLGQDKLTSEQKEADVESANTKDKKYLAQTFIVQTEVFSSINCGAQDSGAADDRIKVLSSFVAFNASHGQEGRKIYGAFNDEEFLSSPQEQEQEQQQQGQQQQKLDPEEGADANTEPSSPNSVILRGLDEKN